MVWPRRRRRRSVSWGAVWCCDALVHGGPAVEGSIVVCMLSNALLQRERFAQMPPPRSLFMPQPRKRSLVAVAAPMVQRPRSRQCRPQCRSSSYSQAASSQRGSGSHTRTSEQQQGRLPPGLALPAPLCPHPPLLPPLCRIFCCTPVLAWLQPSELRLPCSAAPAMTRLCCLSCSALQPAVAGD